MPKDTPASEVILRTAQGHSKDSLDNAGMATFIRYPKTDEAKRFVAKVTAMTLEHEAQAAPRDRTRNKAAQRSFELAVGAFAADLIVHCGNAASEGFMFRSSDRDLLSDTLVSARCFDQIRQFWCELGLMEQTQFFRVQETFDDARIDHGFGKARRFRATSELVELASEFGISPENVKEHFGKDHGRTRLVTVRTEKRTVQGRELPQKNLKVRGVRFEEECERVKEINSYLESYGFDLSDAPRVFRLFNCGNRADFNFNLGGRLYCQSDHNWQNMHRSERSQITWKSQPTVELDVRASQLSILYGLHKQSLPQGDDPYGIPGIERDVVKGVFTAICGAGKPPIKWPIMMNQKYKAMTGKPLGKVYKLREVIDALYEKYPLLKKVSPGRLDWANLQYEESECFMSAMLEMGRKHSIAGLPIHDSLIVPEHIADIAEGILGEAYRRRFNFLPEIRSKSSG